MRRKLAWLLAATMMLSMVFTACGDGSTTDTSTQGSESEKDTSTGSSQKVDMTALYKKGEFENVDLSQYLTLGAYEGIIKVEEADYTVSDAELQAEIDEYRAAYGESEKVTDRAVQNGDTVKIDYIGRMNGVKFLNGSATGYDLKIGSKTFIDDFEEQLIGAKIGDTVYVTVNFPDPYTSEPEFAGKEAVFEVKINSISATVMAEYNDELVKKITNDTYKTTDEFTAYIKEQMTMTKKYEIFDEVLGILMKSTTYTDKIAELAEETYKESKKYYEDYAKAYSYTLEQLAQAYGFADEEAFLEVLEADAKVATQGDLITYALGNALGLELTDDKVLETANKIAKLHGHDDAESLVGYYGAEMIRTEVYNELLIELLIGIYK